MWGEIEIFVDTSQCSVTASKARRGGVEAMRFFVCAWIYPDMQECVALLDGRAQCLSSIFPA